jgi:hypothetical protein
MVDKNNAILWLSSLSGLNVANAVVVDKFKYYGPVQKSDVEPSTKEVYWLSAIWYR